MRAVILTKSYKDKGWCVVAFDLENYELVRLVTNGGGSIPKNALYGINELDEIRVRALGKCPDGPQTENVLVDVRSFERICHCAFGMNTFLNLLPKLPLHEPRFMSDCYYRYNDVSRFHHSIEIIKIRDLHIYWETYSHNEKPKRRCRFCSESGMNLRYRITAPKYVELDGDVDISSAYAIITIPAKPWIVNENETIYFKFVAAVYPIDV